MTLQFTSLKALSNSNALYYAPFFFHAAPRSIAHFFLSLLLSVISRLAISHGSITSNIKQMHTASVFFSLFILFGLTRFVQKQKQKQFMYGFPSIMSSNINSLDVLMFVFKNTQSIRLSFAPLDELLD